MHDIQIHAIPWNYYLGVDAAWALCIYATLATFALGLVIWKNT